MTVIQTKDITISFDFDSTLSVFKTQKVARDLINKGYNVVITTSRADWRDNSDLEEVAENLGITSISYTNHNDKHIHLKDTNTDIHIDDDEVELFLLQQYTTVVPIDVNIDNWDLMLNELLGI